MGYDIERFTSSVDDELKCPVCCGVLEDPVQGAGCQHAYCRRCIIEWMKTSESCPVDRNPLKPCHLEVIPRIVRNLLNHLKIRCDFHPAGCQEVTTLEDLPNHRTSCSFNPEYPIPCPKDCGAFVPKNILETHDCIRDLRTLLTAQKDEIAELKATVASLFSIAAEQREIARNNNQSLNQLTERYDHLRTSIRNLETPIRHMFGRRKSESTSDESISNDQDELRGIEDRLAEETTTEIYVSNVDRSVTPGTLQDFLMRNDVNVISCREALCRGWKNDFKVTILKTDLGKVLRSTLWPKGIVVFVCGEYYSTKIEGSREGAEVNSGPSSSSSTDMMRGAIPPWMMMS